MTNDILDLDVRRAEEYPERSLSLNQIIASLPNKPVSVNFKYLSNRFGMVSLSALKINTFFTRR